MDRVLNRVYSIADHPVSFLDEQYRIRYVRGLGVFLYTLSEDSSITKLFFTIWAKCILGDIPFSESFWCEDMNAIKSALSIQRKGLRFFSLKPALFFDVFYLLQADCPMGYDSGISDRVRLFLERNASGMFSKSIVENIYKGFVNNDDIKRVGHSVVQHRCRNECFLNKTEKKVLVVANVSAGKSTLINALVGYRINKTRTTACTHSLHFIHNKPCDDGLIVQMLDGSYSYHPAIDEICSDDYVNASLHFSSPLAAYPFCLIDSPGVNNVETRNHRKITEDAIKSNEYDAIIYVSDCRYFETNDEHKLLLSLKKHTNKPILFILYQLDKFKQREDSVEKMLRDYENDLQMIGFREPVIVPISARAALFFKLSDEHLDEEDREDKLFYKTQFQKEFYNLPRYLGVGQTTGILERTGISYLESVIIKILYANSL